MASLVAQTVESVCSARDLGLIPGLGIHPGEGNDYTLQHSCLENSMDRGAWGLWSMYRRKSDTTEPMSQIRNPTMLQIFVLYSHVYFQEIKRINL